MSKSDQIREAPERLSMTQETLAERLGVSRQAVSKWKMGVSEPSLENLKALSRVLKIDLSPAKEAVPPTSSRWKIVSCVCIALLLVSLAALALLWTSMNKNGWPSNSNNGKSVPAESGGGRKTVNSHSSLHCCGCSCILSCYMIIWGRQDIQILLMFVKDFF